MTTVRNALNVVAVSVMMLATASFTSYGLIGRSAPYTALGVAFFLVPFAVHLVVAALAWRAEAFPRVALFGLSLSAIISFVWLGWAAVFVAMCVHGEVPLSGLAFYFMSFTAVILPISGMVNIAFFSRLLSASLPPGPNTALNRTGRHATSANRASVRPAG